jgi:hypothetical protein
MEFKEWNLNKALYYGSFNLITSFHFQYFAPNPIIFGYNNLSMFFFNVCQIDIILYPIPYSFHFIF